MGLLSTLKLSAAQKPGTVTPVQQRRNKLAKRLRVSSTQTAHTIVFASNAYEAKLLGEAKYGHGNVLNYTEMCD